MAQIANIVLNTRGTVNGATANTVTYVAQSANLVPAKGYETRALWQDRTTNPFMGAWPMVEFQTKTGSETRKARVKVDYPVPDISAPSTMTGIQPAPSVAFTPLFVGDFMLPVRASLADLQEIQARVSSAVALAIFRNYVETNELMT